MCDRLGLLVDGAEYFDAFAQAAEQAQHSILILAWDFDSRALLHRSSRARQSRLRQWRNQVRARIQMKGDAADLPMSLGAFLNDLARRRHSLQIRILIWDYPMIFGLDREFPPLYGLGWRPRLRVHVRYDNTQPTGASHHQKIVVIDDRIAFCGGLDLTSRRWDTCSHKVDEPRRISGDKPYPPFHDVMIAVDGEAARALGNIARARWQAATGETLQPTSLRPSHRASSTDVEVWPASLEPNLRRIPVAISRTVPPAGSEPPVREIEQLYLDMIGRAKHSIYIENQYFTAHRIGEALAERLAEKDGPEVIVILRLLSHGWLEAMSMEALRTRMIRRLQAADGGGRFRFLYPDVGGMSDAHCIDVHAKLMIVDDDILHAGSANLSNRSMGLDTECDLTIQAGDDETIARAVSAFRNRLLSEHLGVAPEVVERTHARTGSLRATIDELRIDPQQLRPGQRTLREFATLKEISDAFANVVEIADPEKPVSIEQFLPQFAPTEGPARSGRPAWGQLAMFFGLLLAFGAAWRWTPLSELATPERIAIWVDQFANVSWAPIAVLVAYTPASVVMFPRPLITLFAVLAYGPALGFMFGICGNLLTGWLSYLAGQHMSPETLRRLAGPNFSRISAVLRERGVLAVTAVRLVPLAPYAIPGLVAGAARVRLRHFIIGTLLGLLPGTLATTVFGDAVHAALHDAGKVNWWIAGTVIAAFAIGTWWVKRWLLTTRLKED